MSTAGVDAGRGGGTGPDTLELCWEVAGACWSRVVPWEGDSHAGTVGAAPDRVPTKAAVG